MSVLLGLAACSGPAEPPSTPPLAGDWTLDGAGSSLSFVTVKGGLIVENHTFSNLSGTVAADGAAKVEIPLDTINTKVDTRDERMRNILFETGTYPTATVTARLDPASYEALGVGDTVKQTVPLKIDLHGVQIDLDAEVAVTRIAEGKVMVASTAPIIVDAGTFNMEAALEELRKLASLDSITAEVPVSFSLVFTH